MPTDINVADGKIGIWHRFDALDKAVVKDRSVLMSVADSTTNSREQIQTIWTKLGGTSTPPRVVWFNREDLGKNEASQVPGVPPAPSELTQIPGGNVFFYLDLDFDLGGSAPVSIQAECVPVGGGSTLTPSYIFSTYPYPQFLGVYFYLFGGLAAATTYDVRVRFENSFGYGAYSSSVKVIIP